MESQHSVRSRLRAAAPEADDRALFEDQLAEQEAHDAALAVIDAPVAAAVSKRPGLDAFLSTVVRAAYRVDDVARYARSRPFTAFAVAAGIGAVLVRILARGRETR